MTVEELQDAWADLEAYRAAQLAARTPPAPNAQSGTLAGYMVAYRAFGAACAAHLAAPGPDTLAAMAAAGAAWAQAGADLSAADRERLYRRVDDWIGARTWNT